MTKVFTKEELDFIHNMLSPHHTFICNICDQYSIFDYREKVSNMAEWGAFYGICQPYNGSVLDAVYYGSPLGEYVNYIDWKRKFVALYRKEMYGENNETKDTKEVE